MTGQHWETVSDQQCLLGESPVWDATGKSIFWVDILKGEIHRFFISLNRYEVMPVGQKIGAIALRASGGLVAALQNGFAVADWKQKIIHLLGDPESHLADNRFNDGKCDPAGRFWAGTMDDINGKEGAGGLYVLEKDFSFSLRIGKVSCSNGPAWSPDGSILYFTDTPTRQIASYDFDAAAGNIRNRKMVIKIPDKYGYPDGMTVDAEGMLWIAHWNGWRVTRWNPYTGKCLDTISFPASRITSCTFGGDALEDLYVTSARIGLSEEELISQPLAGSLFVIRKTGYKGIPAAEFMG